MMKQTSPAAKIFSWIFALFWLAVCLLPFTQLISVTFSTADRGIVSTFYPNSLSSGIENIKPALLQTNMSPSTLQTLIYVSVTIVGMLIVSSLAAYELACFKFPGRDVIFMLILSSMMLPMITYIIPLYRFVYNLGLSLIHICAFHRGLYEQRGDASPFLPRHGRYSAIMAWER